MKSRQELLSSAVEAVTRTVSSLLEWTSNAGTVYAVSR
jgi:hypothetical protein